MQTCLGVYIAECFSEEPFISALHHTENQPWVSVDFSKTHTGVICGNKIVTGFFYPAVMEIFECILIFAEHPSRPTHTHTLILACFSRHFSQNHVVNECQNDFIVI